MGTITDLIMNNLTDTYQTYGDILEGNRDVEHTLDNKNREIYHAIKQADKKRLLDGNNKLSESYIPPTQTTVAGISGEVIQMC